MSERSSLALERCELHEQQNCTLCHPLPAPYRRGRHLDVPDGHYVSVRGGRGVYHHPDCFNVTGDWDGGNTATLGERVVHSPAEIAGSGLRPADCCQPPLFTTR